jgi:hypothetical protein
MLRRTLWELRNKEQWVRKKFKMSFIICTVYLILLGNVFLGRKGDLWGT